MARARQLTQAAVLCLGPHDTRRERERLWPMPISQPSQLKPQRPRVWGVAPPSPGEHSPWALGGCGKGTEDAPRLRVMGFLSARQSTGVHRVLSALCPLDALPAPPTAEASF